MFSETSCSVLFSCKMRKFVTQHSCRDQLRKYQALPTSHRKLNLILQLNSTLQEVSENIWGENRHYSNRILIHRWSALPSLTVWSEFVSDWQLPPLNKQPIGTLSLWNDLWLAKFSRHRLHILKPEHRVMRSCRSLSYLSEHLNYNMLKGYYGIFAQWHQKYSCLLPVLPMPFLHTRTRGCTKASKHTLLKCSRLTG